MYLGISSYPCLDGQDQHTYYTSVIDKVIQFMTDHGLNIYRMSSFSDVTNIADFARYYLQHCAYDLILDYYHEGINTPLDPVTQLPWTINRAKELLSQLQGYEDRLWIEPCNERNNADLGTQAQQILASIRAANYRNKVLVIRYAPSTQPLNTWINSDPDFWSGIHPYMDYTGNYHQDPITGQWHYADPPQSRAERAITTLNNMQAAGIKCLSTEFGAHTDEYNYYNAENVAATQYFINQLKVIGSNGTLWTLDGIRDYAVTKGYQSYAFTFPSMAGLTLPYHNPLTSLDNLSIINGTWSLG